MIKECHTCITIPIKNPDERFEQCLAAIANQDYDFPLSLLIISSGHESKLVDTITSSYNNTLEIILENIDPPSFQHGRTRNLACKYFNASYYVFITQDAVPASSTWLRELVLPLERDASIVGSYSRHVAHPEHSVFCHAELEHFFGQLARYPVVDKCMIETMHKQSEVDLMSFFSNNSSCIRGHFFRNCGGFPEVDFAEDQAWSTSILNLGYKKALAYKSVIRHSHNLSIEESFGRGLDEAMSFRKNHNRRILGANPVNIARAAFALCRRDLDSVVSLGGKLKGSVLLALPLQFARRISQSTGTYVGSSSRLSRILGVFSRDKALRGKNA